MNCVATQARLVRVAQERLRETAAQPERTQMVHADFHGIEPGEVHEPNPTSKRFRDTGDELQ